MFDFRFHLALLLGKTLQFFLRLTPWWGGEAAPGLLALNIDPDFVKKMGSKLAYHLVVSGTNGKTTTTRILSAIFSSQKINHIHNRSGSNLLRGLASSLIAHSGKAQRGKAVGLWEVDEAVLPHVLKQLKPQLTILTNLFRDQLDRYGEIDSLLRKWQNALQQLPKDSTLILNADDANLAALKTKMAQNVVFYGIRDSQIGTKQPAHAADATCCPICLKPLLYQQIFYAHLGNYSCQCGFHQPKETVAADSVSKKKDHIFFKVKIGNKEMSVNLPIIGLFNVYNALAAMTAACQLKIPLPAIIPILNKFKPAFGRMETIAYKNKRIHLLLVKNPAGFNQIIQTLQEKPRLAAVLIAINDKLADGTDVSWLWDVDFENLKGKVKKFFISGRRAGDMAIRLKYAGISPERLSIIHPDLKKVLQELLRLETEEIYILPTYTALLEARDVLRSWGMVHSSWED